ncbi:MAG: GNAT family N-acetyltransferase [Phycisphaerae bacterium]|jgi:GNAT superfamily N-acetyltransferase
MERTIVRIANASDCDTIAANNIAMAWETERLVLDPRTARAGAAHALADPARAVYYLAEREGKVAGQMMITPEWSDWRDAYFWWIQSVYVRPDARGAGVYRALHRHVEALARARADVCGLRLYVEQENRRAQRVYERKGLRRTSYLLFELDWRRARQ